MGFNEKKKKKYGSVKQAFHDTVLNSDMNTLLRAWDDTYQSLTKSDSFFIARKTLYRIAGQENIDEHTFNELQIIDYILDVFDNQQFVLNPKDSSVDRRRLQIADLGPSLYKVILYQEDFSNQNKDRRISARGINKEKS